MATRTLTKIPVENLQAPDLGAVFTWGLGSRHLGEVAREVGTYHNY